MIFACCFAGLNICKSIWFCFRFPETADGLIEYISHKYNSISRDIDQLLNIFSSQESCEHVPFHPMNLVTSKHAHPSRPFEQKSSVQATLHTVLISPISYPQISIGALV